MKINSEDAKCHRTIARRIRLGKSLAGLLAGIAVGSATSGCYFPFFGLAGYYKDVAVRNRWRIPQWFSLPEGEEMPIGEYTQLQLEMACTCRCEEGRCFLTVYAGGGQTEEFEITEHINRMLKASGSDGIVGIETVYISKPEVLIWPLREDLALAVSEVGISGKVGERFTGFELKRCALLRKETK